MHAAGCTPRFRALNELSAETAPAGSRRNGNKSNHAGITGDSDRNHSR
jgi:hypothetical protein